MRTIAAEFYKTLCLYLIIDKRGGNTHNCRGVFLLQTPRLYYLIPVVDKRGERRIIAVEYTLRTPHLYIIPVPVPHYCRAFFFFNYLIIDKRGEMRIIAAFSFTTT
jgi:hypothetical protein